MSKRLLLAIPAVFGLLAAASAAAPEAVPDEPTAVAEPPERYVSACAPCHANGGFAVRVLVDKRGADRAVMHERNDLRPEAIRAFVRYGAGAMPAMSKAEVSDAELEAIIAYLTRARVDQPAP